MADTSKIEVRGSITDTSSVFVEDSGLITNTFTSGVRQQQTVTLTASTFSSITVPTGAKAVLITGFTGAARLKGVTGDTGIVMEANCPVLVPLGTTPSLGILEASAADQTLQVYWF